MNQHKSSIRRIRSSSKSGRHRLSFAKTLDPNLRIAIFGTHELYSSQYITLAPYLAFIQDYMKRWHQDMEDFGTLDLSHVCRIFEAIQKADRVKVTIDSIVQDCFGDPGFERSLRRPEIRRNKLRHLVFDTIGLVTLLYLPYEENSARNFCTINLQHNEKHVSSIHEISLDLARRPLSALLRCLKLWPGGVPPSKSHRSLPPNLLVPLHSRNLRYQSLMQFGNISIKWTCTLSDHLSFEESLRQLSLFRLPSYCLIASQHSELCALNKVTQIMIERATPAKITEFDTKGFLKEILMSYRILFGQHRQSRAKYWNMERQKIREDGEVDRLLDILCGSRHLTDSSVRFIYDHEVYSMEREFPIFGQRLAQLQQYGNSHSPKKLKELWQDRRHPLEWFTFWAVIVVGGISILLSIAQIAISAAQLGISMG